MTYFPDLSEYKRFPRRPGVLNVGWLDEAHPIAIGETTVEFQNALKDICNAPILLFRGFHLCEFCEPGNQVQGNGQIRVEDQNSQVYAAPTMIYHYVTVHGYRPPREFIEAVLNPKRIITMSTL